MPPTSPSRPRPARRSRLRSTVGAAAVLVAAVALMGAACSSAGDDGANATSTVASVASSARSATSSTVTPADGSTTTTATTPSSGPGTTNPATPGRPGSPSTLPASVDGPCQALRQTYGLDAIQPQDTGSWPDERQRIAVDARREAALLGAAQTGTPPAVAGDLAAMEAYASWLATTVSGASNYLDADRAMGAYPDRGAVPPAVTRVSAWRSANC